MLGGLLAPTGVAAALVAASALHVRLAARGRVHPIEAVPFRPVGMVLGARAYPGRPSRFLAARLDTGFQLLRAGKVDRLLVSGDGGASSNHETAVMRDYLLSLDVPAGDILEDPGGLDTYDSCVRARHVFGITGMTVVSQAFHVPRAIAICRWAGIDAVGVGEITMQHRSRRSYHKGQVRELAANIKMEWDTLSARAPGHGT